MTKKIFLLLPIALLFTACSNKESQVNLNENKTNEITLSYGEYKKLYEAKNKKVKNLPIANYEPIITPKIKPPKRDKKSGSNNIFFELPITFSASSIPVLFPTTIKVSP